MTVTVQYLQYRTVDHRYVQHLIMMNITWWRFDQSAKQLVVGHTTNSNLCTAALAVYLLLFSASCYLGRSVLGWLGSRVVSVLDSGAEGPGFKSQSQRCQVTVFGKTVHTHHAFVHQAAKLISALLTAKNRDHLRNPMLSNEVLATFTV